MLGEYGTVKKKKKYNDEVIMENRQIEALGKKSMDDPTAPGFKSKKLIILVYASVHNYIYLTEAKCNNVLRLSSFLALTKMSQHELAGQPAG